MTHVTVIGGGVAGLAATETARTVADTVSLYEADPYELPRRGAWGELVRNFQALPVDRSLDGVVRSVEHVTVYTDTGRLQPCFDLHAADFVLLDRGRFEIAWAEQLREDPAVTVHDGTRVTPEQFDTLAAEADLVIDASGPRPLTATRCTGVTAPTRCIHTISASATGDFSAYYPVPGVVAHEQTKLFISTKTPNRATYGVGWMDHRVPAAPRERFAELCESAGIPYPPRGAIQHGQEPIIGSRPIAACFQRHNGTPIRLVGDAAGLVNGLTRFGMNRAVASAQQAIRSWAGEGSYRSWLRRVTRRNRLQSRIVRPIEDVVSGQRIFEVLGRVSNAHPVTRF